MKKTVLLIVTFLWSISLVEAARNVVYPRGKKYLANTKKNRAFKEEWDGVGIYKNIDIILFTIRNMGNNRAGAPMLLLMSLPDPNQVVRGVLLMTGKNKGHTVEVGRQIIFDCTDNEHVTVGSPLLTAAATAVTDYENAHGPAVHEYYRAMIDAFEPILLLFNNFVKIPINRNHAISTLQSGGFHVVGPGGNHVAVFGVRNSVVAGEFILTGDVDPDDARGLHDWWYSTDNIIWTRLRPTKNNHTKKGGFSRGQQVWFRHELIVEDIDNPYGLSDPISRTAN